MMVTWMPWPRQEDHEIHYKQVVPSTSMLVPGRVSCRIPFSDRVKPSEESLIDWPLQKRRELLHKQFQKLEEFGFLGSLGAATHRYLLKGSDLRKLLEQKDETDERLWKSTK